MNRAIIAAALLAVAGHAIAEDFIMREDTIFGETTYTFVKSVRKGEAVFNKYVKGEVSQFTATVTDCSQNSQIQLKWESKSKPTEAFFWEKDSEDKFYNYIGRAACGRTNEKGVRYD